MDNTNSINENERVAVLTTNPKAIYNSYTLLHIQNLLEALEGYNKTRYRNGNKDTYVLKARILTLYYHIRQDLKRNNKEEKFKEIEDLILSDNFEKMFYVWINYISDFLATTGLIVTAKAREYDTQDPIGEDDAKGF